MISPRKAANQVRRAEAQALVTAVPCGPTRGLVGIKLDSQPGSGSGEYFVPFAASGTTPASDREFAYAGLTVAIDRLRDLKIDRVLIVVDDEQLVEELERRVDPPREVFLQYVILGCKLNEFRRAKVVAVRSSRLEQLRAKTENLAATIYNTPLPLAHAI
jgi:hypothetical protein